MQILDDALDCGLSEHEFWEMSLDELSRFFQSFKRRREANQKQTIRYLYTLADLCAYSIARVHNEDAEYEDIEVYFPELFKEEYEQHQLSELDAKIARFVQYTQSFNNKFEDE